MTTPKRHFHWCGVNRNVNNFGDALGSLLLKKFANFDTTWAPIESADIITVGSILDLVPQKWRGLIVGSGKLREHAKVDLSDAKVLSLRGPLTASSLGVKTPVLGDLGLLADELVPRPIKTHDLGLVPHWSDTKLEKRPEFLKYKPLIIRATDDPLEVIKQIGSCRKIVSSSLHGIILADAFGIPRRTEMAERFSQEGGSFKFRDYAASLEMPFEVGLTQQVPHRTIVAKQHEMYDVLMEAVKLMRTQ